MNKMTIIRFLAIITVIITMIGASGCMNNNKKQDDLRNQALIYLKKYDDTFTAKSFASSNWAYEYSTITFESKKYNGAIVEVRAYKNQNGTYFFKDNYFKVYMLSAATDYFSNIIEKVSPLTIKIRFPNTVWSDEIGNNSNFEDWVSSGNCLVDVFVISQVEWDKTITEQFIKTVTERRISGEFVFITTNDSGNLVNYTLDDILNNQSDLIAKKSEFHIPVQ